MKRNIKNLIQKEFFYYLLTLLILALIMHIDLLSDPLARFQLMEEKQNYSHPFLYSFIIYFIIFILRKIIDFIMSLFQTKED